MDANEKAAAKLDKETKKVQEEQAKQFDMPRKNMPSEPDMGPLPTKKKPALKYRPSEELSKFNENYKKGGSVSSASKRADGIATKGKTKGRII